jgi:hypothetical protein
MTKNPGRKPKKNSVRRVRIPARHWTAVPTIVFDNVLYQLRLRHSANVYFALYHRAWHRKNKRVKASLQQIAKWTHLNYRTVKKCLGELQVKGHVWCIHKGTLRSRTDLAVWQVHAAEFNIKEGNWVPVPAFFFTHYIPAHRSCLLLPLLLYYQNLKKQNTCYASAFTLQLKLHWTLPFTYQSLRLLSNEKEWSRLKTGLPLPLAIQWRRRKGESTGAPTPAEGNPNFIRHYSLRSVWYSRDTDDGLPVIYLTPEFAKAFNIPTKSRRDILPEPID